MLSIILLKTKQVLLIPESQELQCVAKENKNIERNREYFRFLQYRGMYGEKCPEMFLGKQENPTLLNKFKKIKVGRAMPAMALLHVHRFKPVRC